jgi:hypothetical protein
MKEKLRQFYALRSKKTAQTRLKDLVEIALLSDDAAMVQWGRTLQRWSPTSSTFSVPGQPMPTRRVSIPKSR